MIAHTVPDLSSLQCTPLSVTQFTLFSSCCVARQSILGYRFCTVHRCCKILWKHYISDMLHHVGHWPKPELNVLDKIKLLYTTCVPYDEIGVITGLSNTQISNRLKAQGLSRTGNTLPASRLYDVVILLRQGLSCLEVGRRLGCDKLTIDKFLNINCIENFD